MSTDDPADDPADTHDDPIEGLEIAGLHPSERIELMHTLKGIFKDSERTLTPNEVIIIRYEHSLRAVEHALHEFSTDTYEVACAARVALDCVANGAMKYLPEEDEEEVH